MCAPLASASTSSGCAYSRSIRSRTRRSRARSSSLVRVRPARETLAPSRATARLPAPPTRAPPPHAREVGAPRRRTAGGRCPGSLASEGTADRAADGSASSVGHGVLVLEQHLLPPPLTSCPDHYSAD